MSQIKLFSAMIWGGDIQDTKLIALNRDVHSKPTWNASPHIPDTKKVTSQSRIIKQLKDEKLDTRTNGGRLGKKDR
jgi:hypothetical protein